MGILRLSAGSSRLTPPPTLSDDIFVHNRWITRKGEKLVWLPYDYRGFWASKSNVLAIGQRSGLVNFIGFKFELPMTHLM
jgi:hypothetical protein